MTESIVDSHHANVVERGTQPPTGEGSEKLAVWRVVTEVDLTSGSYPVSRVRWRRVHTHSKS